MYVSDVKDPNLDGCGSGDSSFFENIQNGIGKPHLFESFYWWWDVFTLSHNELFLPNPVMS